ncbi:hypothetical protein [Heyndrickxia acidicola]|uniref:Uncharacterized protein n=1 Tax=Heyndrickxia acidicola TaxID=209389 RepID=A0ABU6MMX9_9BACI|nr:hypothetical protein [Heyndrickxia acidicola]MED1205854.1 hypothetical protein [Heyndrickxia acidicola]
MALQISTDKNNLSTTKVSSTNPISTTHPVSGSTVPLTLYLWNDDATKKYTGITIDPVDTTGSDESSWIALAPDNAGNAGTYLAGSAALSMADINDSNVAHAFWYQCTTPTLTDSQNKTDIQLNVSFTEFAV